MIPFVEDYLSELIHSKISHVKRDPGNIRRLLGVGNDRAQRIHSYLNRTDLKVIRGYPRTPAELPCVCILLSGESEIQDGVGEIGEVDMNVYTAHNKMVLTDVDGLLCAPFGVESVMDIISVTVEETGEDITEICSLDYGTPNLCVVNGSQLKEGQTISVEFSYINTIESSIEVMYELNYRVEVWTQNGDLTVELYHLVKAIFLSGRPWLIEKGLIRQRLGGSDFQPAPSFFPEFVYRRSMTLWTQVITSVADIVEDTTGYIIDGIIAEEILIPNHIIT